MRYGTRILGTTLAALTACAALAWYAAWQEDRRGLLTVSFLDVGQGDAIFIDAPSGRQALIDGGPTTGVLRRLGETMSWWDRSIDVVIATHPDTDHVSGLADVLDRYRVGAVVRSSVAGEAGAAAAFDEAVSAEGARVLVAMRGQVIDLGNGARLEILFPDRALPRADTNDASIVARLVYGDTTFLFTGDAPQGVERYLVFLDGSALRSDVLKAGHHGSKTASSPALLGFAHPAYGIFSRGCDNRYGHPASEVVARFQQFNIPTLDTCTEGTISFVSDGETVKRVR